jgi:hypothetical protein
MHGFYKAGSNESSEEEVSGLSSRERGRLRDTERYPGKNGMKCRQETPGETSTCPTRLRPPVLAGVTPERCTAYNLAVRVGFWYRRSDDRAAGRGKLVVASTQGSTCPQGPVGMPGTGPVVDKGRRPTPPSGTASYVLVSAAKAASTTEKPSTARRSARPCNNLVSDRLLNKAPGHLLT